MKASKVRNFLSCTSAAEINEKLTMLYEQKSSSNKMALLQKYHKCRMERSETMMEYITKIRNLAGMLADIEETQRESFIMSKILGGLPEKYGLLIVAWDSVEEGKQTLSALESLLVKQEQRLDGHADEGGEGEVSALATSFKRSRPHGNHGARNKESEGKKDDGSGKETQQVTKCFICKKPGHIAQNCRYKKKKMARRGARRKTKWKRWRPRVCSRSLRFY